MAVLHEAIKIIETKDGSHTLYRGDIDETYHSQHGAMSESIHIFIENGLAQWIENEGLTDLSILEVGFGTGLNAALTMQYSQFHALNISYTTLEPFPVELNLINQINYFDQQCHHRKDFLSLHEAPWSMVNLFENFRFQKIQTKLEEFESKQSFDIVFFDAFAPEKQPELWDLAVLKKLYALMNKLGIITTYCAKGEFKRNLMKAGFKVFSLPGPLGGKREMVRGEIVEKVATCFPISNPTSCNPHKPYTSYSPTDSG